MAAAGCTWDGTVALVNNQRDEVGCTVIASPKLIEQDGEVGAGREST